MNKKGHVEFEPPKSKKEFSKTKPRRRSQFHKKEVQGKKPQKNKEKLSNKSTNKNRGTRQEYKTTTKMKRLKIGKKRPLNRKPIPGKKLRTILFWIFIFMGALTISSIFSSNNNSMSEISYSKFKKLISDDKIEFGIIEGLKFTGNLKTGYTELDSRGQETTKIKVELPNRETDMFMDWNFDYRFKEKSFNWTEILLSSWPIFLLIGFWIFMMRRMQGMGGSGGGKGIFSFAKSPAHLIDPNKGKVTFNDVAGCDEAKEELQEIIAFLKNPKQFERLGGLIPKGVILIGAPGTGKTLLARAVAGEAGAPFFSLSGADFVEMFVGVGAARVRDLFAEGKKNSPCIIFIDEIDAVGRKRFSGIGGGHDEREQTLNQLLVELDGFEANEKVIVIAATNRHDVLDNALLRPGRFDRRIIVDIPDVRGREAILKIHAKKIPKAKNVDFKVIAQVTPGLSGADLASIVNEAALLAARRHAKRVEIQDFEQAKDKVTLGVERKSMVISEEEKKITAYHESGHALIAILASKADPIHKVTIIPRGQALGLTHQIPIDDRHIYPRSYIETQLKILLGGRNAEKLIFNELTTGAGNDIERVTEIAYNMVTKWGMSDLIGPMTYEEGSDEIFLGRDISNRKRHSEETARLIDREVMRIVRKAEKETFELLRRNIDKLKLLARTLLEKETLDKNQINAIFAEFERKKNVVKGKKTSPKQVQVLNPQKTVPSKKNKYVGEKNRLISKNNKKEKNKPKTQLKEKHINPRVAKNVKESKQDMTYKDVLETKIPQKNDNSLTQNPDDLFLETQEKEDIVFVESPIKGDIAAEE